MERNFQWRLKFGVAGLSAALGMLTFEWYLFLAAFGWFFHKVFIGNLKTTAWNSFTFWMCFFVGNLYWLFFPLTVDLKSHYMLIPFAVFAIPAYLAAQLVIPAYLTKKYFDDNIWKCAIAFSVLNFAVMYFYGHCAPGFPWVLPGYVWSLNEITLQTFSIWGIYGQTFLTLFLGCVCGIIYGKRNSRTSAFLIICGAVAFLYGFGYFRLSSHPTEYTEYRARSIQASLAQEEKINKELSERNLQLHLDLSKKKSENVKESRDFDFIIWPEASVPYLYRGGHLKNRLSAAAPENGYLIAGVVRKNSHSGEIFNSVIALDRLGETEFIYDKRHLVPFGEYVPLRRFIPKFFGKLADTIGDFDVGTSRNVTELKGLKIAFAICYEAIFPGETVQKYGDADVLINITNDAWFGHTAELLQHSQIVRARAVEEGIPLIRATNFGISGVYDAYGREIKALKVNEVGVMDFKIPAKAPETFYKKNLPDFSSIQDALCTCSS